MLPLFMQFTKDQQRGIDARNKNILVSAAAGSGKTAVLVERIIQMVTDEDNPVDIDKLLIFCEEVRTIAEMLSYMNYLGDTWEEANDRFDSEYGMGVHCLEDDRQGRKFVGKGRYLPHP